MPEKEPEGSEEELGDDFLKRWKKSSKQKGEPEPGGPPAIDRLLSELEADNKEEVAWRRKLDEVRAARERRISKPLASEEQQEEEDEFELPDFAALIPGPSLPPREEDRDRRPAAEREAQGPRDEEPTPDREAEPAVGRPIPPAPKPPLAVPARPVRRSQLAGGLLGRGRVNGGRVNGGRVNGGRVNGGRVNGGRVNGGRVNGGRVNGGWVNGTWVNGAFASRRRALARRRTTAAIAALLAFGAVLGPLLYSSSYVGESRIDGDFQDWAGYQIMLDTVNDQAANPSIDLVGVAAQADERNLYFYLQIPQQANFFEATGNSATADAYSLLVDVDRQAGTGYNAFGLGIDFVIVASGHNGTLTTVELMAFPSSAPDRADADAFRFIGTPKIAFRGSELEGAVALSALGLNGGASPFILALTQDSLGNSDVADAVITTAPGVLVMSQVGEMAPVLPTAGEARVFSLTAQAQGADIRLVSFDLTVDSPDGGGVQITRVVVAGSSIPISASGSGGSLLHIDLSGASSNTFQAGAPTRSIELFGRGTGPDGSVVRLFVRGATDVEAVPVKEGGASGHGSILAPLRYSYAYVNEAPLSVKVDGAFADWNQSVAADADPMGDVSTSLAAPSMGGPNLGTAADAGLDIVASRAEVSATTGDVSFMLEVAGSIMSPSLLKLPTRPGPELPSGGGTPGGPPPPPEPPSRDLAQIYVDTDLDPSTGWTAFSGMGVDAIIDVAGAGGGYGRAPRQTETSISLWSPTTQSFAKTTASLAVGFNSSAMETQASFSALCGGLCIDVRYIFYLRNAASDGDATTVRDGTARGMGDTLFFDEERTSTKNVFQGDLNQPILAFTVTAPSTNENVALVGGFEAVVDGATAADLVSLSVFNDSAPIGTLDLMDLADPPLGSAPLTDAGTAEIRLAAPIALAPGEQLFVLLTVDVAAGARAPSWFNVSIAREGSLLTLGGTTVLYGFSPEPSAVRILDGTSGFRGQNDLTLNEVLVTPGTTGGWVEVYDTTNSTTSLTTPSQFSLRIYTYRSGRADENIIITDLSGSTNSNGFAAFDVDVRPETGPRNTRVELYCNNCTAGGGDNSTFVDQVTLPLGSPINWGRLPDGTGSWDYTTNTTKAAANLIPEFQEVVVPVLVVGILFAAASRTRARGAGSSRS